MDAPTRDVPKQDVTDGLPPAARFWAMTTLAIAIAMAVLDGAIANIALPSIARDMQVDPATSIWVVNAYQLAVTVALLPIASLGDIYGFKRVYIFGLAVFTVASLGCALSASLPMLVVARMVQGIGAAGIMSVNGALVRFVFPRAQLGRGIGYIAVIVATSSAAGPSVAAAILSIASWHWLFAINVPLGVFALWLAARALPRTPSSGHRFDAVSAVLNAATFGLLVVAVDDIGSGARPLIIALEFAGSIVAGTLFIRRQFTLGAPMLPVDLFRKPIFALSVGTSICAYAAQALTFVALPFFFEYVAGHSQIETGLLMTPWPLIVVVLGPLAGRLSDRFPPTILGGLGLVVMTAGLLLLLFAPSGASFADIAWRMTVCGAGFGFFQSPNNRMIMGTAPPNRSGAASGMLATARLLGQTVGSALVALVFGLTNAISAAGIGRGAMAAIGLAAGFAALGAGVSALRLRQARRT
jgi:DHA2 family multidrug resistance protein-like MFS transporter